MTTTESPSVEDVLRAIDRAALLPLLPAEEARMLAVPVARVMAGVTLPIEDQRAAARLLQAARAWLDGPLASLGLAIPAPPEPVHHAPAARVQRLPEAKMVDGGQRIGVRNVFTMMELVKALPGYRPAPRGGWHVCTVPATPAGAHNLLQTLSPFGYRVSKGVTALAEQYEAAVDARRHLADGAPLPDVDPESYGVNTDLWTHQIRGVSYGEASAATCFAIKMGGGKTLSAIALAHRVQASTVLIVCPNRVRRVWPREVREKARQGWHIVDGTRPSARRGGRRQDLKHPERLAECNRVLFDCECGAPVHAFVVNYEALSQRVWQEWTPAGKIDLIVYDEAHRLKNYRLKVKATKPGPGPQERRVRAQIGNARAKVQAGTATAADAEIVQNADELIMEARRLDTMGPAERELRAEFTKLDQVPPRGALQMARLADRRAREAEEEFRANKLTVSGVAARWVDWSHRRVALTGTPFPQHPWDIFGLYRALDTGVFGQLWTPFRDEFVQLDRTGTFPIKIKREKLAEFASRCMSLMYRPVVDLNLPGCTDVVRELELEPDARKVYDQLDTELWADLRRWTTTRSAPAVRVDVRDLDTGEESAMDVALDPPPSDAPAEITAKNVLSRLLRLQQLTGGTLRTDPVLDPSGRTVPGDEVRLSRVKAEELAEFDGNTVTGGILEEIGCVPGRPGPDGRPLDPEPTIVFCRFRSDLDAVREVAERAGLRYGEISGRRGDGLNDDARMAADRDLVGVQIQAGGTGVDLTRARYGIWYSLGYSVSDYDQARARLYRPGQTRPVVYIHLIAADTMDQAVYDAIRARKAAVAEVLRAGGVDPADLGLDETVGPDPTAQRLDGQGSAGAAVEVPWEES